MVNRKDVIFKTMNMKDTKIYKRLIIANIILFISSFVFLEYSKIFRLSFDKHWIYSFGTQLVDYGCASFRILGFIIFMCLQYLKN